MAAIDWRSASKRYFESGIDRVTLYVRGYDGVPWFGVAAIKHEPLNGEIESYYVDGFKYLMMSDNEEFSGVIKAYSKPEEFDECLGNSMLANGLYVSQQRKSMFNLSYRTLIGSDSARLGSDYKIHLVYNALVGPWGDAYETMSDDPSIETTEYIIETKPIELPGYKPVSHLYVDTRTANSEDVHRLEGYLYGSEEMEPFIPNPSQVHAILSGEELVFEEEEPDEEG